MARLVREATRMEPTPLRTLRQVRFGSRVLIWYAVVVTVVMAVVGVVVPGTHALARTAAAGVAVGWLLLIVIGAVHRRTRRSLMRTRPDLAPVLAGNRRRLPGSGWAIFVYLPLLLAGVLLANEAQAIARPGYDAIIPIVFAIVLLLITVRAEQWYSRNIWRPYMELMIRAAENDMRTTGG
jgi:hypothetical protein